MNSHLIQEYVHKLQEDFIMDKSTTTNGDKKLREECLARAESLKDSGNDAIKAGDYNLARGKYEEGIELLDEGHTEEIGTLSLLHLNNALACLKVGAYKAAIDSANIVLKNDENNVKAMFRRACAFLKQQSFDEAKKDILRVLEIEPGNAAAKKELVSIIKLRKEWKEKQNLNYGGFLNKENERVLEKLSRNTLPAQDENNHVSEDIDEDDDGDNENENNSEDNENGDENNAENDLENDSESDSETALTQAITTQNVSAVQVLIAAGADVNKLSKESVAPIVAAATKGNIEIVRLLLDAGAKVNTVKGPRNDTALIQAAHFGHSKVVCLLIKSDATVDYANLNGTTALMRASQEGHRGIVRELIDAGADVNKKNNEGMNALMLTSRRGSPEMALLLISRGAAIDEKTEMGTTALMHACTMGKRSCVEVLVTSGAKIDTTDLRGISARDIALRKQHHDILQILDSSSMELQLVVESVVEEDLKLMAVASLLDRGAYVGKTALDSAYIRADAKCSFLLLLALALECFKKKRGLSTTLRHLLVEEQHTEKKSGVVYCGAIVSTRAIVWSAVEGILDNLVKVCEKQYSKTCSETEVLHSEDSKKQDTNPSSITKVLRFYEL